VLNPKVPAGTTGGPLARHCKEESHVVPVHSDSPIDIRITKRVDGE